MTKKAKVIGQKKDNLFGGRKWPWAVVVAVFLFLFALAMPMAMIPGLSRLAGMLGISPEFFRTLTLSDLAAYAVGAEGNRVDAARYASGAYTSAYDYRGGLSSISMPGGGTRLFDAHEAYRREYELTGKWPPGVMGPLSMAQFPGGRNVYEGVGMGQYPGGMAPMINGERAGPGGEYGPGYGGPIAASGAGGAAGAEGAEGGARALVKPVNPFNIVGVSNQSASERLTQSLLDSFKGGRLGSLGGFGTIGSRVGHGADVGQLGAFGDLGRAYVYSSAAVGAGYKATAKQLAEAAIGGGDIEDETIVLPGEQEERTVNALTPPSTVMNKMRARQDACKNAKAQFESMIKDAAKSMTEAVDAMEAVGKTACSGKNCPGIPGTCSSDFHKKTVEARDGWNEALDGLVTACQELKDANKEFSGQCGFEYNPKPGGKQCSDLKNFRAKGQDKWRNLALFKKHGFWTACKKLAINDRDERITFTKFRDLFDQVVKYEITGVNL